MALTIWVMSGNNNAESKAENQREGENDGPLTGTSTAWQQWQAGVFGVWSLRLKGWMVL